MSKSKHPDLEFLQYCSDEDLKPLVRHLTCGEDDTPRVTSWLASQPDFGPVATKLASRWEQIAEELERYGGDSLVNLFRNGGVPYREILHDVAKNLKAPAFKQWSATKQEEEILQVIVQRSFDKMTDEQKRGFTEAIKTSLEGEPTEVREQLAKIANVSDLQSLTPALTCALVQTAIRAGGFLSYQVLTIALNAVSRALIGRGLTLAGNAAATRALGVFLGPVGWLITGALTVPLITGPAYRVTVPAVVHVAALRRKLLKVDAL